MDTRLLRYFVAVAEERHFGRAAERLNMAQPPLSQQIKQFEQSLGFKLLERTTRRVDLTPAGELVLTRGRRILQDMDELAVSAARVAAGAEGVLRIGFSGSATYRLMPYIIREAHARMPGLDLVVQGEMLTPEMELALDEHRIDLAILRPPVRSSGVRLRFLERDELVAIVPADSPWAQRGVIDLADLADEPFVCYPPGSAVSSLFQRACQEAGFLPEIVQVASETSTLMSLVAAGVGSALLPGSTRQFAASDLVFRPLARPVQVDLALAWCPDRETPLVRNFVSLFDSIALPEQESERGARPQEQTP